MTIRVIDRFEAVNIQHRHRQQLRTCRIKGHALNLGFRSQMVEQACQTVVLAGIQHFPVAFDLGFDHRRQDDRVCWFGQELVPTQAQRFHLLRNVCFTRQINHRQRPVFRHLTQGTGCLDAGAERHVHIHQNDIRAVLRSRFQQLPRVIDGMTVNGVLLEGPSHVRSCRCGIFDDQDAIRVLLVASDQVQHMRNQVTTAAPCRQTGIRSRPLQQNDALQIKRNAKTVDIRPRKNTAQLDDGLDRIWRVSPTFDIGDKDCRQRRFVLWRKKGVPCRLLRLESKKLQSLSERARRL